MNPVSKKSEGLFHKAICQSGSLKWKTLTVNSKSQELYEHAQQYFEVNSKEKLKEKLRASSLEDIISYYRRIPKKLIGFGGTIFT